MRLRRPPVPSRRNARARRSSSSRCTSFSGSVSCWSAQLQRIELPERLRDQIDLARRLSAREALRRQMQYIGRLMREADVEAIRARLAIITGQSEVAVGLMHRCERLREQLLSDDQALTEFLSKHREVDAQWLHGKIRAARRERDDGAPPHNLRELYRWLHQQLQQEAVP